jgi:hypothetical protein
MFHRCTTCAFSFRAFFGIIRKFVGWSKRQPALGWSNQTLRKNPTKTQAAAEALPIRIIFAAAVDKAFRSYHEICTY